MCGEFVGGHVRRRRRRTAGVRAGGGGAHPILGPSESYIIHRYVRLMIRTKKQKLSIKILIADRGSIRHWSSSEGRYSRVHISGILNSQKSVS